MSLLYVILAVGLVSILSLVGIFALSLNDKLLDKILFYMMSFSAGAILGTAFFDLLPESLDIVGDSIVFSYIALGFVLFYFLERLIYWYHGHGHAHDEKVGSVKNYVYLNLIGDGIHNLIDGMVITTAFLISVPLGIASTVAVIFHELPQEIGDFGILIFGGLSRKRALLFNFLSALTAFVGVALVFLLIELEWFSGFMISISVGAFIYLAAAEILPELKKEQNFKKNIIQFIVFILGLLLIRSLDILPI